MDYFFAISLAVLSSVIATLYKEKHSYKNEKISVSKTIKDNRLFMPITLITFVFITIGAVIMFRNTDYGMEAMYRWLLLIYASCLVSYIDIKERIIPNMIIIVLFAIRIGFLIYEIIIAPDSLKLVLMAPSLGMLIGGGLILLAMLISRKSIGMGDVKLFAIIGLYVGSKAIIPTLFCTFFFSAIFGLMLLIIKKAKIKDTMPMAPFAAAGILVNFVLSYIGG